MKLFDLDGPIYKVGTEIADFLILAVYWIVCCLPIITIGASTSSLFYVFGKKVRGEDAYVTKDFFKAFKQNFKQSIPLTLLLIILWLSVFAYYIIILGYQGETPIHILVISVVFMVEVILFSIYSLAILSRFYMKLKQIIVTSLILAHRHALTSFLIIVSVLVVEYLTGLFPLLFFLSPVIIITFSSMLLQKVFTMHIEAAEEMKKAKDTQGEIEEDVEDEDAEEEEEEEEEDASESDSTDKDDVSEDKDFLKYI